MIKRAYLEITDACNLDCPFCTNKKGNSFLSIEEIDDYLNQIKEYTNYVYLHVLGEPLIHTQFKDILDLLDKKDMNLQLVTNGTLLNKYDLLKHKCLRKLSISIHSINNTNINDDYFNTINSLIETNTSTNIELRFYDLKSLDQKLLNYLDSLKNKYGFKQTPKKNSYSLKDNVYVYFEELFDWPSINSSTYKENGTCRGAKDQIAILVNSDVTICCLDPNGYNKIGNLKEKSLSEILNSLEYKNIINNFNNNKLTMELCKHCTYCHRFN